MTRYFSNVATPTTVAADVNNTDVTSTITVNDVLTGWPNSYPFTALIDKDTASEEMVLVTNVNSTIVTATRAVHGYAKYSHSTGASFVHAASAQDLTDYQYHLDTTSGHQTHLGMFPSLVGNTSGHRFDVKFGVWRDTLDTNSWAQITHGMGATPDGAVVTVGYAGNYDSVISLVDTFTSTTFGARVRRASDGSTAPRLTSAVLFWVAWKQI